MTPGTDDLIAEIARTTKVIAVVGLSPKPERPSYGVARYLQAKGFQIVPVNPGHDGQEILGERCYGSLAAIPEAVAVDMVDIFRRSDAVPGVVDEALAALPRLRTIWMQLGVSHAEAAAKARAEGVAVIENRCPKIDFPRYI